MAEEIMVGEAARILTCSANHVRYLERVGYLHPRRVGIYRIFDKGEVERLAAERYRKATGQAHWHGDREQV